MRNNVICIKSKKNVTEAPKAIEHCGNHYKVYIPSCYLGQTIDQTQELLDKHEPNEPSMAERVEAIDKLPLAVQVVHYPIGRLYEQV